MENNYMIRKLQSNELTKIKDLWIDNWGSDFIISKGKIYYGLEQEAYIAEYDYKILGLLVFRVENSECEILSFDSFKKKIGIGINLLKKIKNECISKKLKRIFLITTNDNTYALKFYQKQGYDIKEIYKNTIVKSRLLKPTIPILGFDNIPIRHEIELELNLKPN